MCGPGNEARRWGRIPASRRKGDSSPGSSRRSSGSQRVHSYKGFGLLRPWSSPYIRGATPHSPPRLYPGVRPFGGCLGSPGGVRSGRRGSSPTRFICVRCSCTSLPLVRRLAKDSRGVTAVVCVQSIRSADGSEVGKRWGVRS